MCVNCMTTADVMISQGVLAVYALKTPAHRMLANAGLTTAPDPIKHDVFTVRFLESLDLDPVAVLGAAAVEAAAAWTPQPAVDSPWVLARRWFASARPILSHSLLASQ